jgi:hypothetical protein
MLYAELSSVWGGVLSLIGLMVQEARYIRCKLVSVRLMATSFLGLFTGCSVPMWPQLSNRHAHKVVRTRPASPAQMTVYLKHQVLHADTIYLTGIAGEHPEICGAASRED